LFYRDLNISFFPFNFLLSDVCLITIMHINDLFKKHKIAIVFALSLIVIENIAWIIEPTFFGQVIDAIFDDEFQSLTPEWWHTVLVPLSIWTLMFIINSAVGAIRRYVDPRIFMNIFTDIANSVSEVSVKKDYTIAKTTARAQLSYEYIVFYEFRMPEIIENIIAISGAVLALYFIDWRISVTCLAIALPLFYLSKLYSRKVSIYQKDFHDHYENMFDIFSKKDPNLVRDFFNRYAVPQKKIGNWNAMNFGIMRFFLLLVFILVLYISIVLDGLSAGEIYSVVAYLWTFITATEFIPEILESWTSLKDISRRLRVEEI
jgi:ABC-type multidrug transport system fused ATPase/permease subunit